jgi:uncharacterized membrane protein (DUF485 family)
MRLFKKKGDPTTDNYYQQRELKPMAWLLAIVTFVVTLLLILILFFAGRWAWNKIFGNDSSNTENTTTTQTTEQGGDNSGSQSEGG